ncbi:MAG: hypothetical protein NC182_07355 [Prevotella sp.]|nr:hypothetical protein [Staphylococcus sp.]MCM1350999.1 hypothetical protein [Prevotella sp.]
MVDDNQHKLEVAYDRAISTDVKQQVIGIQKEKVLHKTLKYFLCENEDCHEVKIAKTSKGVLYADIKIDQHIYEIQTRNFNALREKLDEFLKMYQVTIVYPIPYRKQIYKIDNGVLQSPKTSPKKGRPLEVCYELYKIKTYLNHPNLSFQLILLDVDEYRQVTEKKYYRSSGYERIVQIPKRIEQIIELSTKEDYSCLLRTYSLPQPFTSSDFAKATHLTQKKAGVALHVFTYMNIVERIGKRSRSYLYQLNQENKEK